ncbi:MAG: twin-arginine translocation signal domain-containing protein, partial [Planctomycetia bacterium]|nr:twin-arginine translocation signal domain-containing protein [Planctomycetia bacterium]
MIRLDADKPATFCDGSSRRDFLHAGALTPLGLTLGGVLGAQA